MERVRRSRPGGISAVASADELTKSRSRLNAAIHSASIRGCHRRRASGSATWPGWCFETQVPPGDRINELLGEERREHTSRSPPLFAIARRDCQAGPVDDILRQIIRLGHGNSRSRAANWVQGVPRGLSDRSSGLVLDYSENAMRRIRLLIVIGGILLPFIAAIVNSSLPLDLRGVLFLGALNSICWGSILLATTGYRDPNSAIFPIVTGFAWPTLFYLTFNGKSSPLGFIFLPIENLGFVFAGWLVGRYVDKRSQP
jgi:hypothetical protein